MIAIIAGTGTLPIEACKRLLAVKSESFDERGLSNRPEGPSLVCEPFFVIVLFPDDNLAEIQKVTTGKAEVISQECYKAGQILNLLKNKNTTKLLFIGKVDKSNLF